MSTQLTYNSNITSEKKDKDKEEIEYLVVNNTKKETYYKVFYRRLNKQDFANIFQHFFDNSEIEHENSKWDVTDEIHISSKYHKYFYNHLTHIPFNLSNHIELTYHWNDSSNT